MRLSNSINLTDIVIGGLLVVLSWQLPAFGQRTYDPNLGHFYMGRQQITIEDDSPIVNDKTGGTAGGANGGLLNRPTPLPKAGWQPYAPVETPGLNPNLPKVPGPVRQSQSAHTAAGAGNKGRAGRLSAGAHSKPTAANGIRGYKPYTTYPAEQLNPQAASDLNATTHVKGSLLHWARRVRKEQ